MGKVQNLRLNLDHSRGKHLLAGRLEINCTLVDRNNENMVFGRDQEKRKLIKLMLP